MRIFAAAILLCLPFQDDPVSTLAKRELRGNSAKRQAAAEQFRGKEKQNAFCWAAARFLEKSDRDWRLVYDRLTTKSGVVHGRADGSGFFTFAGQRFDLSAGKIEKDVADAAAADMDAIFAKHYTKESLSAKEHQAAFTDLAAAYEKFQSRTEALDLIRLFARAHAASLGKDTPGAYRVGLVQADDRWGTEEEILHYRLVKNWNRPGKVEPALQAEARSAPGFGTRYVILLHDIHEALEGGANAKATFSAVNQLSVVGAPKGADEHRKALAQSFKNAVYCKACKDGKAACGQCGGKAKIDKTCGTCDGAGRVRPPGVVGGDATVKCRDCDGKKVFKGIGCPGCAKTGMVNCDACAGRPWRDRACTNKECKGGKIACGACKGKGRVGASCGPCGGSGRIRAPGATESSDATFKCRDCEGRGTLAEQDCKACGPDGAGIGFAHCETCSGGKEKVKAASFSASDVYGAESCAACGGRGWPVPGLAEPCARCFGLGAKIKPSADPAKTLGE